MRQPGQGLVAKDFNEYLRRYPQGAFAALARERLRALRPTPAMTNWEGGVVFRGRIQGGSATGEARSKSCAYVIQLQKVR